MWLQTDGNYLQNSGFFLPKVHYPSLLNPSGRSAFQSCNDFDCLFSPSHPLAAVHQDYCKVLADGNRQERIMLVLICYSKMEPLQTEPIAKWNLCKIVLISCIEKDNQEVFFLTCMYITYSNFKSKHLKVSITFAVLDTFLATWDTSCT